MAAAAPSRSPRGREDRAVEWKERCCRSGHVEPGLGAGPYPLELQSAPGPSCSASRRPKGLRPQPLPPPMTLCRG